MRRDAISNIEHPNLTSKRLRLRRLSREGFWVVLGQGLAVFGGLAGVRLMTELLDPSRYGELALGLTLATLVNQTVLGPLANGVTRFYAPAYEQTDLKAYMTSVGRLMFSATALIGAFLVLAIGVLVILTRVGWVAIVITAFLYAIVSGYNSVLNGIQNASRHRSIVAFNQGIEPCARFLVASALIVWLGASSALAMGGYAMGSLIVLGSQYLFLRKLSGKRSTRVESKKDWHQQIVQYSWPISLFGVFTWLQLASDRWALGVSATTQEVGLYSVLLQVGYYPMSLVTGMAMQFLAPIYFQRAGDASDSGRNRDIRTLSRRLTVFILGVTAVAFVLMLIFHADVFGLLAAKDYASASSLLPWILLAGGLFAAGETIALTLMSELNTRAMIAPKIITALLGVTLNFAGAIWFGMVGVIVAAIVFSALYFLWMAVTLACVNK